MSYLKRSWNLVVRTLTGETETLEVTNSSTVQSLKERIHDNTGIPTDQQKLIFSGSVLDENRLLKEYSVSPGDTVHLVLRLRGGFFLAPNQNIQEG